MSALAHGVLVRSSGRGIMCVRGTRCRTQCERRRERCPHPNPTFGHNRCLGGAVTSLTRFFIVTGAALGTIAIATHTRDVGAAPSVVASDSSLVPECVRATAWVKANHRVLPTTLEAFSRYSVAYRRAIFNALPENAKAGLWRAHLESYLTPSSRLNRPQRDAVLSVIARLDGMFQAGQSLEQRRAAIMDLDLMLAGLFEPSL